MLFYNIGALIKIILGAIIIGLTFFYINPLQDPAIGLSFFFLGIFLISWGISFYLFFSGKSFFQKVNIHRASESYKMSLLFGLFIIINLGLIFLEQWNKTTGVVILIVFIFLHLILNINDRKKGKE